MATPPVRPTTPPATAPTAPPDIYREREAARQEREATRTSEAALSVFRPEQDISTMEDVRAIVDRRTQEAIERIEEIRNSNQNRNSTSATAAPTTPPNIDRGRVETRRPLSQESTSTSEASSSVLPPEQQDFTLEEVRTVLQRRIQEARRQMEQLRNRHQNGNSTPPGETDIPSDEEL